MHLFPRPRGAHHTRFAQDGEVYRNQGLGKSQPKLELGYALRGIDFEYPDEIDSYGVRNGMKNRMRLLQCLLVEFG